MTDRLGSFVAIQREKVGLSQSQLADRADLPRQTVNRLEQGVTKLPGAFVRRKLAEALGVSHLDLLVAAGEITKEEANLPHETRNRASQRLAPILDRYDWSDEDLDQIARAVQAIVELKRGSAL